MQLKTLPWRLRNALARLIAGVPLGGESVSPLVQDDLYVAHLSIYDLFARRLAEDPAIGRPGLRVLDLGSGTGYGAAHLQATLSGATVVGLDVDDRSVRFARRRYERPGLRYVCAPADDVEAALAGEPPFDAVVSSNVLEHLEDPGGVVDGLSRLLTSGGRLYAAVPPICDQAGMEENEKNPFHLTNLHVTDWHALFAVRFDRVTCLRQRFAPGVDPDFRDPRPSGLEVDDFRFEVVQVERFCEAASIGVVFDCSGPGAPQAPIPQRK